ncbi:MAG TPA: prepilin-type N-terminal cleavage/methylation domain-containing protein [Myxococcaceae bacterium]|nr:prepilin-type N-terminal cleavage/methylation domain-containing protein [Myxococcaceae bacterium]
MSASSRRGFTLLEAVVALAILAVALMAIFDLNAGAVASHAYGKKLTVATMLARSKMTDLEQQLYDQGFPTDTDEESGDFSDEGWSGFRWSARIVAPDMDNVSPDQLMGALLNVPTSGEGRGLASLFSGGGAGAGAAAAAGASGAEALGPMGGLIQGQFQQMAQSLRDAVREVQLKVTWKDGEQTESLDLVTHVVSLGPGSDRNGAANIPGGGAPGLPNGLPPNFPPLIPRLPR